MLRPAISRLGSLASNMAFSRPLSTTNWRSLKVSTAVSSRAAMHELELPSGRFVRYREVPGQVKPSIVYVPGLHSYAHMDGMLSQCLFRFCDINNFSYVTYDHECMGQSEMGSNKKNVLFSHWVEDVKTVVEQLTEGPVVLVSCSMGGWLSLVAAMQIPERIHGMVLYAPAINYVRPYYQFHVDQLPPDVKKRLDDGAYHVLNHQFGNALLKKDFAEDSIRYEIDLESEAKLPLTCPIRIIHGLQDQEVTPETSLKLTNKLESSDVDLIYRKHSEHQAEQPFEIELILNTIDRLLKDNPIRNQEIPANNVHM